jgi:hypothetical protein
MPRQQRRESFPVIEVPPLSSLIGGNTCDDHEGLDSDEDHEGLDSDEDHEGLDSDEDHEGLDSDDELRIMNTVSKLNGGIINPPKYGRGGSDRSLARTASSRSNGASAASLEDDQQVYEQSDRNQRAPGRKERSMSFRDSLQDSILMLRSKAALWSTTFISASETANTSQNLSSFQSSSLSMFESEELWSEFRAELDKNHITSRAGVQAMLQKFAEKNDKSSANQDVSSSGTVSTDVPSTTTRRGGSYDTKNIHPLSQSGPSLKRASTTSTSSSLTQSLKGSVSSLTSKLSLGDTDGWANISSPENNYNPQKQHQLRRQSYSRHVESYEHVIRGDAGTLSLYEGTQDKHHPSMPYNNAKGEDGKSVENGFQRLTRELARRTSCKIPDVRMASSSSANASSSTGTTNYTASEVNAKVQGCEVPTEAPRVATILCRDLDANASNQCCTETASASSLLSDFPQTDSDASLSIDYESTTKCKVDARSAYPQNGNRYSADKSADSITDINSAAATNNKLDLLQLLVSTTDRGIQRRTARDRASYTNGVSQVEPKRKASLSDSMLPRVNSTPDRLQQCQSNAPSSNGDILLPRSSFSLVVHQRYRDSKRPSRKLAATTHLEAALGTPSCERMRSNNECDNDTVDWGDSEETNTNASPDDNELSFSSSKCAEHRPKALSGDSLQSLISCFNSSEALTALSSSEMMEPQETNQELAELSNKLLSESTYRYQPQKKKPSQVCKPKTNTSSDAAAKTLPPSTKSLDEISVASLGSASSDSGVVCSGGNCNANTFEDSLLSLNSAKSSGSALLVEWGDPRDDDSSEDESIVLEERKN